MLDQNNILSIEKNMFAFIFKLEFTDNTIRSITDLLFFKFNNLVLKSTNINSTISSTDKVNLYFLIKIENIRR